MYIPTFFFHFWSKGFKNVLNMGGVLHTHIVSNKMHRKHLTPVKRRRDNFNIIEFLAPPLK